MGGLPIKLRSVIEVGAGYGRTAWVMIKLYPELDYTIVDIEPALSVSCRYLTSQFPNRSMHFRNPETLVYHARSADLMLNISSFHEMDMKDVRLYFDMADRVSQYFYFKEWKESKIPLDETIIRREDYPVKSSWVKLFNRECAIQPKFFEALYKI